MKSPVLIFSYIIYSLFHLSPKTGIKKEAALLNGHNVSYKSKTRYSRAAKLPIHNFVFTDDKGQQHPLFDSTKKTNMVVFWASWCSPCRMEIPNLKDIYKGIDTKSFRLISISVDKDKDAWLKAVKEEQMPWPQLLAEGDNVKGIKADFGFTGIPQIYFIDNNGKVLDSYTGYHYDEGAGLRALVKQYSGK